MRRIAGVACMVALSAACIGIPLHCYSEEDASGVAKLIEEAKVYIQEGDKAKAVSTLDNAFEVADSAGNYEALMEIGDLYISIDTSLQEKAMRAWLAAGRWKSR